MCIGEWQQEIAHSYIFVHAQNMLKSLQQVCKWVTKAATRSEFLQQFVASFLAVVTGISCCCLFSSSFIVVVIPVLLKKTQCMVLVWKSCFSSVFFLAIYRPYSVKTVTSKRTNLGLVAPTLVNLTVS
jgi:hypothetical protein